MKISLQWLNEFIALGQYSHQQISDILTMKTCEVEHIDSIFEFSEKVIVGEVKEVTPHPNADKLRVCRTQAHDRELTIVTGANNAAPGRKYPLAVTNARLPNGMKIKRSKLRGLDSEGMLCSAEELGLENFVFPYLKTSGDLLVLPSDAKTGSPLQDVFPIQDTIFTIDNKSITHRPDLWGHFGFVRELSAVLNLPIKKSPYSLPYFLPYSLKEQSEIQNKPETSLGDDFVKVTIKDDSAISYSGCVINNIEIKPSDIRIQARLISLGIRPINNVVDASNYVMLEMGQPNHSFDLSKIKGDVGVSFSQENEEIVTLDSEKRKLPAGVILIRDQEKPIAIGGIIGGENSQITDDTKHIFIESACFHRQYIRRGVSQLSLRTEASQRFEKGQDPSMTEPAIFRFYEILKASCADLQMNRVHTILKERIKKNNIKINFSDIQKRLGNIKITPEKTISILESMGMKCSQEGNQWNVEVPSFRSYHDIEIPEDIIEETARIFGYDQIREEPLFILCEVPSYRNQIRKLEHDLRHLFSYSYHFMEVYNYCFHSAEEIDLDHRYASYAIELKNAIHQGHQYMRISPLPGLLKNIAENHKKSHDLRFYEIEKIFLPDVKHPKDLPFERNFIAGVLTSNQDASQALSFLGSILSDSLSRLGCDDEIQKYETLEKEEIFHPGRAGKITSPGPSSHFSPDDCLFKWGEIHPRLIQQYNIEKRVYYFEGFLDVLNSASSGQSFYKPLFRFPSSVFELTILAEERLPFQKINDVIESSRKKRCTSELKEHIECIDSFSGEQITEGKKAVSIRLTWMNRQRTIEHEELKALQDGIVHDLSMAGFPLKQ